jgi:sugar transport system ATP-binding protein
MVRRGDEEVATLNMTTDGVIAATRDVVRRYPGVLALDHVSFEIRPGQVRALLGKNGAGKSTLIRLLSGVEQPDEGIVEIDGRPLLSGGIREASARGVATVYQELSLVPQLTVAENLYLGHWPRGRLREIDSRTMRDEASRALKDLGLDLEPGRPVETLTLAEQQMVEIARALRTNPRLLILDEPTSALAAAEVSTGREAVRRIASSGVAVIYVSHRMEEIRQVADSTTVMRDGRLIDTVDTSRATTEEIVRMMLGSSKEDAEETATHAHPETVRGPVLLSVRDLAVPPKLTEVSFDLHRGEVLGIAGLLGSGRTELIRTLSGFDRAARGTIAVEGEVVTHPTPQRMRQLGIGMTPENRKRDGIVPWLGVDENIVMSSWGEVSNGAVISAGRVRQAATALAERLAIKTSRVDAPIGTLSGGNQQKAVIGRWLHARSRILLLDEPTRGVDVEAKAQIYQLVRTLAESGNGIVFVSSELEELPLVCDRVLVLRRGQIAEEFMAPNLDLDRIVTASIAEHM